MQVAAIQSLNKLRENGENKGLLISATGTGKTYLSAFELRNYNPNKALFIVHREQIAKQALNSFKNVFGDTRSMGILSGTSKDLDKDFIFCTVQTLSKDAVLYNFSKDEFDYLVIYDKSEDITDTINYEDRFLCESQLIAISKPGRTISSDDIVQAYNAEKDGVEMSLFVRKNKDDKISKEFYFLGKIRALDTPHEFIMKNTTKTAVEIKYQLITPVREDIYEYITS